MEISEIRVGMLLDMTGLGNMHYIEKARVEATGHDWFVIHDDKGQAWFVDYGTWDLWENDIE